MCRQGHDKERCRRTEEGLSRSEGQGRSEKRTRRRRRDDVKKDRPEVTRSGDGGGGV